MSVCPAYLGLTIFDAGLAAATDAAAPETKGRRSSVLLRSDLLIFCPSNFSVTVRLLPLPAAAALPDADHLRSVVVRFSDSASPPFHVRLAHVRSNATAGTPVDQGVHTGARRRPSPAAKTSPAGDRVVDFTDGTVLIAVAITGALFVVVYVGQNTARATAHVAGTLLSMSVTPSLWTPLHLHLKVKSESRIKPSMSTRP